MKQTQVKYEYKLYTKSSMEFNLIVIFEIKKIGLRFSSLTIKLIFTPIFFSEYRIHMVR